MEVINDLIFNDIVKELHNSIYKLAYKNFKNPNNVYLTVDDLYNVGLQGLLKAMQSYDKDKASIHTHAYWWIDSYMKSEINKTGKINSKGEIKKSVNDFDSYNVKISDNTELLKIIQPKIEETNVFDKDLLIHLFKPLDEREHQIMYLVVEGYKQSEIAEKYSLSRERVGQIVRKSRVKMSLALEEYNYDIR